MPEFKRKCRLSDLPVEILDQIFRHLDVYGVFVLGLGLQNRYFWKLAERCILADWTSSYGCWAGKGIVCIGDYSVPGDDPPDLLLTEIDKNELRVGIYESELEEEDSLSDDDLNESLSGPVNLYRLSLARYRTVKEDESSPNWRPLLGHASEDGEWDRLPRGLRVQIACELRSKGSDLYPEDQQWILRNLTTREYVRSEAIAIKPECIQGPYIKGVGFGEVVWSRICWSADPSCSMANTDNIHRGPWAGHCFDITTLDRHLQRSPYSDSSDGGSEWKDISEEMATWVEKIWRSEFGSDWRRKVVRA